ncbi:MAG: phosphomannomutase/phosphoglucomutase [bacterium]|nr:phosphomannomutase/phosphoglucomutase [bacterium]
MYVNPDIFKAYDIRGIFPEQINGKIAYIIARAFADYIRNANRGEDPRIVVGSDERSSSPELKKATLEGLLDSGVNVIDQGLTTTPFHYFTVRHEEADGGMMITASHNPFRMNGFKLSKSGAEPVGDDMEIIKKTARRGIFEARTHRGEIVERSNHREYYDFLLSQVNLEDTRDLKVVFDTGGGMVSLLLPNLLKRIPSKSQIINMNMSLSPSRAPLNPIIEESLAELKNEVIEKKADLGVAFDPDGDRVGFVTNNARFFRPDYVAALFARELLKTNHKAKVVYDVRSSSIFNETVEAYGGTAIMSRVGHRFIKEIMRKEKALFAAELSGHYYFESTEYSDSGFLPVLYFLQFLAASKKTSDELLNEFAVYPSSGELSFNVDKAEGMLENIAGHFHDAKATLWVDGVSVYYDDWWANVRLSNTENLVRLNVEARTIEVVQKRVEEFKKLIVG